MGSKKVGRIYGCDVSLRQKPWQSHIFKMDTNLWQRYLRKTKTIKRMAELMAVMFGKVKPYQSMSR